MREQLPAKVAVQVQLAPPQCLVERVARRVRTERCVSWIIGVDLFENGDVDALSPSDRTWNLLEPGAPTLAVPLASVVPANSPVFSVPELRDLLDTAGSLDTRAAWRPTPAGRE